MPLLAYAMMLATLQAHAMPEPPRAPAEAVYSVHGSDEARSQTSALFDHWSRHGAMRRLPGEFAGNAFDRCIPATMMERIDADCVRALRRSVRAAAVTLIVREGVGASGNAYTTLTCIGPQGEAANLSFTPRSLSPATSPQGRLFERNRVVECINAAMPNAVIRSVAAMGAFDFWGTGDGPLFYNRLSGDCERMQHRIGRNSVWGGYTIPLSRVSWSVIPSANGGEGRGLRLACTSGECIQIAARGNQGGTTSSAAHIIPFGSQVRAERFVATLDELRRSCRR